MDHRIAFLMRGPLAGRLSRPSTATAANRKRLRKGKNRNA
jgi:hypothetical protein